MVEIFINSGFFRSGWEKTGIIPYLSTTYPHFVDNVMLIWDPM